MPRLWTLVLVLYLAIGCGTGSRESADAEDVRYGSVYDLRDILESNGFTCDSWSATEFEESGDYATQSADCTRTVAFSVYEGPGQVQNALDFQYRFVDLLQRDLVNLVGASLLVCCPDLDLCTTFQPLLGGRIVVEEYVPEEGDLALHSPRETPSVAVRYR